MRRVILLVIALCLVSLWYTGCANASHNLAVTEDAVHDHLAKVDDEYVRICGPQGTTPSNPDLKPVCADVKPLLLATLEAGAGFNSCVVAQKAGCLVPVIEAGGKLVEGARKLPKGETVTMISELVAAVAAAVTRAGGQ